MVIDTTKNGQIRFANVAENVYSANASESKIFLKVALNTNKDDDFYPYRSIQDEMGNIHEKFQQTFKGLKVEFGEFIVHKNKAGSIYTINGDFKNIPGNFGTIKKLSFDDAIGILRKKMSFDINTLPEEQSVESPPFQESKQYEVVVVNGYDDNFHLAYKVEIMQDIFHHSFAYIDCGTGNIVFEQPLTTISNAVGSASTLYSGTVSITTDYTTNYTLKETARGGTTTSIHMYNFNRAPSYYSSEMSAGVAGATEISMTKPIVL